MFSPLLSEHNALFLLSVPLSSFFFSLSLLSLIIVFLFHFAIYNSCHFIRHAHVSTGVSTGVATVGCLTWAGAGEETARRAMSVDGSRACVYE